MKKIHEIEFNHKTKTRNGFEILSTEKLMSNPIMESKLGIAHKITFYAVMFIVEGSGKHGIDFKSHSFEKGSLIFVSSYQVHTFSKELNYKGYLILFTDEFLMKNLSPTEIRAFSSLYNYEIYNPVIQVGNEFYDEFLRLIKDLEVEFQRNADHLKEDILRNKLKVLLLKAERYKTTDKRIVNSKYYAEFLRFQTLLKVNIKTEHQVQFYASKLFMSTKKLNAITQELLGSPAKKVISDIRILKIKRSLMNLSQNIKEIAFEFGFDEPTNFVKFFKKYTGITPTDFRELNP